MNEAQRLLSGAVAAEPERVEQERKARAEAVERLRERVEPVLNDEIPSRRYFPAGPAQEYALKRWSPRRNGWRDVAAFDERVLELQRRQEARSVELGALQERLTEAEKADREALAACCRVGFATGVDGPGRREKDRGGSQGDRRRRVGGAAHPR